MPCVSFPLTCELTRARRATPLSLRMQALTTVRLDDILAHVTFTGSTDSRLYPVCVVGSDSGIMAYGTRVISHPRTGQAPAGVVPTNRPLLYSGVRDDGVGCMVLVLGVGRCAFRPPRVV